MSSVTILEADLDHPEHQRAIVEQLNAFASDPMVEGKSLPADVLEALIPGLREHPTTLIFLAYSDKTPIGIAVCFRGFSTFYARPLVNIHDLAVISDHRGQGTGRKLLEAVESKALELGCCKLTLEVQENNHRARQVYEAAGFAQTEYVKAAGRGLFLAKPL